MGGKPLGAFSVWDRYGRVDRGKGLFGKIRGLGGAGVVSIGLSCRQVDGRRGQWRSTELGGGVRTDGSAGDAADAMVGCLDVKA